MTKQSLYTKEVHNIHKMDFIQPKNDEHSGSESAEFVESDSQSQSRKHLVETDHFSSLQIWKVMLMLVTLIFLYLISCSFLCAEAESNLSVSENVRATHNYDEFANNDFNQEEQERLEQRQQQLKQSRPQANDIFAELTHSQGHIDDYNNYYYLQGSNKNVRSNPADSPRERQQNENLVDLDESDVVGKRGFETKQKQSGDGKKLSQPKINGDREKLGCGITCKDENGVDVSWYILYKLPQIASSSDGLIRNGSKYFYLLPGGTSWTPSEFPINSNSSMLSTTLEGLWSNETDMKDSSHVIYNDQAPSKPAVIVNGHTKGLIITSSKGGLWLQHSCPHFPDIRAQNFTSSYPIGGLINGQMFMCMTFNKTSDIDRVGSMMQYTKPFVYNYSIPLSMDSLLPELTKVVEKNATVKKAPWFNVFEMTTESIKQGQSESEDALNLKVFTKGPKFRNEIYSAWIAPEYGVSLDVQSWLNGPHPFTSNCTSDKFPVYNILMKNVSGQSFSYTNDHSKWAVGTDKNNPVVCVGDLNRMKPQKSRGGVTICFKNEGAWTAFNSLVAQTQPCNSTAASLLKGWYQPKYKLTT